jgi:hypothetical protein
LISKLSSRFDQLHAEIPAIDATKRKEHSRDFGSYEKIDDALVLTWKVKVKNLIVLACGADSQHFKEFEQAEEITGFGTLADAFSRMKSVFTAAMDDYNGGYLQSIKQLVQAEVFESELEQSQELLSNGYKLASAVIAGVVLETALRDKCAQEGIGIGKLDKMNADLAKEGHYNKLQQKRITALADIRNSAAHGKPDEFTEQDVGNMIRDIEQFLARELA